MIVSFTVKSPFDTKGLPDGLYTLTSEWIVKETNCKLQNYIYIKDSEAYNCLYDDENKYTVAYYQNKITEALGDPKQYTTLKGLTYPTSGLYNRVVQVKDWQEKAHVILAEYGNISDAYKVTVFCKYLADNYAYDNYHAHVIGVSRATYETQHSNCDGHENPDNFMLNSGVAVCWDYTNTLAIMCREYGIPCTSASKGNHTWAVVYIDNEWTMIDIVQFAKWECNTEDTDKSLWVENNNVSWSTFRFITDWERLNTQIWTKDTAS